MNPDQLDEFAKARTGLRPKLTPEESKAIESAKPEGNSPADQVEIPQQNFVTWFLYFLIPFPALCQIWTAKILAKGGMEAFGVVAPMVLGYVAFGGVFIFGVISLMTAASNRGNYTGILVAMLLGLIVLPFLTKLF